MGDEQPICQLEVSWTYLYQRTMVNILPDHRDWNLMHFLGMHSFTSYKEVSHQTELENGASWSHRL